MRMDDYKLGLLSMASALIDKAFCLIFYYYLQRWSLTDKLSEVLLIVLFFANAAIYYLAITWYRFPSYCAIARELLNRDTKWCFDDLFYTPLIALRDAKCFRCRNSNRFVRPFLIVFAYLCALPVVLISILLGFLLMCPWLCVCLVIFVVYAIVNVFLTALVWFGILHTIPHKTLLKLFANNRRGMFQDYRALIFGLKRSVVTYLVISFIPCFAFRGYELNTTRNWNAVNGLGLGWGAINMFVQMYVTSRWTYFIRLGVSHNNVVFENRDLHPISV